MVTSMRILIADDSERVRRTVRMFLSSMEYDVCGEAADGTGTLRQAKALSPDLILLDVSMPDQSGLDTARCIRDEMPGVKVILMSQHDLARLAPCAAEVGAHACVDKSQLATRLAAAIESAEATSTF
jgi:DNA-binding NarL/FixJ family response regulator